MSISRSEADVAWAVLFGALKKPKTPGICAGMLVGCFATMNAGADSHIFEADDNPLDVFLAFITTPRLPADLSQIADQSICRCSPSLPRGLARALHRRAREAFPTTVEKPFHIGFFLSLLLQSCANALKNALQNPPTPLYKVQRRVRKHGYKTTCWPKHPRELVPHGQEDTMRGLLQWMDTPHAADLAEPTMTFLIHVIRGTRQLVLPYIVTSPTLSNALVKYLMGCYIHWNRHYKGAPAGVHSATLELLSLAGDFYTEIYKCADRTQFLMMVEGRDADTLSGHVKLFHSMLHWISQVSSAMEPLNEDDNEKFERAWQQFSEISSFVYVFFESARLRPQLYIKAITDYADKLKTWHENPVSAAFYVLLDLYGSHRCASPHCSVTFASEERKLRHCKGCDRTPYCSEHCQRIAWRHPTLPHKSVCPAILFVAQHGMLDRAVKDADFQPFLNAHLVNTADQLRAVRKCKMIVAHFEALQAAKMADIRSEAEWLSDLGHVGLGAAASVNEQHPVS